MTDADAQAPLQNRQFRILFVALNYAPDLVGCAKYTTELAEELVSRGYAVSVVTGPPYYPDWKIGPGYSGVRWSNEKRGGVDVYRVPMYVPKTPSGLKRLIHLASFGLAAAPTSLALAIRFKPDLVFSVAPTLAAAPATLVAGALSGASSWLHVQDLEVDAAFELGVLKGSVARNISLALERILLRSFNRISSISPAMVRLIAAKGVKFVVELRNWVDLTAISDHKSSNTDLRRELGISPDEIVALYSGNMAAKQGLESLADVARLVEKSEIPVTLILCGAGPARQALEAACRTLKNVKFLPLQPLDRLSELLGTADIHLLPQRAEAADLVLPSKLTGMLASGRPVVAMAAPESSLAAEVEGCGLAVQPDAAAMAEAVLILASDRRLRESLGAAARVRAQERWQKARIIDGFEAELNKLRNGLRRNWV